MREAWRSLSPWRRVLVVAALVGLVVHSAAAAYYRTHRAGDFGVVREFGRRFLLREPLYAGGTCFNYMPIMGAYSVPWALLPAPVGTVIRSLVAVACLVLVLRLLAAMVRPQVEAARWDGFLVGAWTVVLGAHYIVRDLDDGGPHLMLLAMLVGGIYCAWRGRQLLAATWLGLAIALKITPGLLLPYLAWKRQWRLALLTGGATLLWIVAPALWLGPDTWWQEQQSWNRVALSVVGASDRGLRDENEVRVQNQSLEPALLRVLTHYPPGHRLRLDHPADVAIMNLPPATAGRLAKLGLLLLALAGAWWMRRPLASCADPAWPVEASAVLVAALLYSPVTWLQHVVFIVPALYLIVVENRMLRGLPPWAMCCLAAYGVMALGLNRELIGKANYLVLLSLHMHTLCLLLVLLLVMRLRPAQRGHDPSAIGPVDRGLVGRASDIRQAA